MLDDHAVFRAVDPPGGVEKPSHDAPQRDKEPGALLQPVIARSGLEAAGAFGGDGRVRLDGDFQTTNLAIPVALQADVAVNESGKTLNRVEKGFNLQLNSWSPFRVLALFCHSQITRISGDQLFGFTVLEEVAPRMGGGGERRRRSAELQFAAPPVATRNGLAAPAHRRDLDVRTQINTVQTKSLANRKCVQNHPQKVLQTHFPMMHGMSSHIRGSRCKC
jgi:hypothetical protein